MLDKLIDIVGSEGVDHLTAYFTPGASTGQWFETFTGGGHRAETRDRITAEDLYAVEALSVQVPFPVGRDLIEGQLGRDVGSHLREIPTDVELGGHGGAELVTDNSHASQAWHLLNNRNEKTGIGWVIAGKILARKRPKLLPVYDTVVRCQFGAPQQVWAKLHGRLAENDGALRTVLTAARTTAGVDDRVSVLRALDVILWRRHVAEHRQYKPTACPGRGSVEL